MSTLLEIKSSVLRQVQVCPSFRRRTEQEPDSNADTPEAGTGAWCVPGWEGVASLSLPVLT